MYTQAAAYMLRHSNEGFEAVLGQLGSPEDTDGLLQTCNNILGILCLHFTGIWFELQVVQRLSCRPKVDITLSLDLGCFCSRNLVDHARRQILILLACALLSQWYACCCCGVGSVV